MPLSRCTMMTAKRDAILSAMKRVEDYVYDITEDDLSLLDYGALQSQLVLVESLRANYQLLQEQIIAFQTTEMKKEIEVSSKTAFHNRCFVLIDSIEEIMGYLPASSIDLKTSETQTNVHSLIQELKQQGNEQLRQSQLQFQRLMSALSITKTEERSVQVAVRLHRTLELAEDRFFIITCGKTGFARDDNTHVALKFMDSSERRVRETVYGREYTIKAELTQPNTTRDIRVRNCFAFSKRNTTIPLIDDRGCPLDNNIITRFRTNSDGTSATAVLKSMFKFPEGSEVHLQCDVVACRAGSTCPAEASCTGDAAAYTKSGRALGQTDDGVMLAATTVFVLDPADAPLVSPICEEGGVRPAWLLWLTIALGVLFLIMLLMNIFLCTAMSCSCARTEIIEKEPSIIEEYDPYRSWHGSQYGSRYSLHGRDVGHNKGYTSGGSTIHSNRSLPIDSDHYAIVHSRPGSRHSGAPGHRSRGPPSNL